MTAVYAAPATLLTAAVIYGAVKEGAALLARLLNETTAPAGYESAPGEETPGIRVNPGREPW